MTLMEEIHHISPTYIKEPNFICKVHKDNQSCIKMANSNKFTPRANHIDFEFNHFKSQMKQNKITVHYCRTEDQTTYLLTKPLTRQIILANEIYIMWLINKHTIKFIHKMKSDYPLPIIKNCASSWLIGFPVLICTNANCKSETTH